MNEHQQAAEDFESQLDSMEPAAIAGPINLTGDPNPIAKVCGVYQKARPFLLLVTSLFFIPEKWKNVIRTFTGTLDTLCPQQ